MAYNTKNRLKRIIDIQEITLERTNVGVTQRYIYYNIIEPKYHISQACFYNYLAMPAKRMLRAIDKREDMENKTEKE